MWSRIKKYFSTISVVKSLTLLFQGIATCMIFLPLLVTWMDAWQLGGPEVCYLCIRRAIWYTGFWFKMPWSSDVWSSGTHATSVALKLDHVVPGDWNKHHHKLFCRGSVLYDYKLCFSKWYSLLCRSWLSYYSVTWRSCPVCCPDIWVKQPFGVGQTAIKHVKHLDLLEAGWQKASRVHLVSHTNK